MSNNPSTILVFSKQHACLRRFIKACTINSLRTADNPKLPHLCFSSYTIGNSAKSTAIVVAHSHHALLLLLFGIHYQLASTPWPALPIHSVSAVELKIPGFLEGWKIRSINVNPVKMAVLRIAEPIHPLYSHQLSRALPKDTGRWKYRTMGSVYI